MKTIWKYPIDIINWQCLNMPANPTLIHAGLDPQGTPCVWAIVEPDEPCEPVSIRVVGTGHPFTSELTQHVGSFNQGPFVWHVFR